MYTTKTTKRYATLSPYSPPRLGFGRDGIGFGEIPSLVMDQGIEDASGSFKRAEKDASWFRPSWLPSMPASTRHSQTTLHYTTLHYTALHYTTRHYTTRHDTTRHDTTRHGTARHGTARHGTARHGTARHGSARHDTTRHDTTRHYTTLHYTTLHYTTLHYTTLHYTTLHYTTLHHSVQTCWEAIVVVMAKPQHFVTWYLGQNVKAQCCV